MTARTGIIVNYHARYWSYFFPNSVVCEIRSNEGKFRIILDPNNPVTIPLQSNERYEMVIGVIPVFSTDLSLTAAAELTLQEGEMQQFLFTPPMTSLGTSTLKKE